MTPLFNPRNDEWAGEFELANGVIVGKTPTGRATVDVLAMNLPYRELAKLS